MVAVCSSTVVPVVLSHNNGLLLMLSMDVVCDVCVDVEVEVNVEVEVDVDVDLTLIYLD